MPTKKQARKATPKRGSRERAYQLTAAVAQLVHPAPKNHRQRRQRQRQLARLRGKF